MQEQRQRSRAAGRAGGGPALRFEAEATAHLQRSGVPVTDDRPKCVLYSVAGWRLSAVPELGSILSPYQSVAALHYETEDACPGHAYILVGNCAQLFSSCLRGS